MCLFQELVLHVACTFLEDEIFNVQHMNFEGAKRNEILFLSFNAICSKFSHVAVRGGGLKIAKYKMYIFYATVTRVFMKIKRTGSKLEPDTSATRHFGIKTPWDTSAPQNWCWSLRRITGGAVTHRNCPASKCPGFSSITALVSKCLVPRFWCRSVLWPTCPVTFETNCGRVPEILGVGSFLAAPCILNFNSYIRTPEKVA